MTTFDDPRHRDSERLVVEAERALAASKLADARALYVEAAQLEEDVALEVPAERDRVRGVLAVSAASLWLRAEHYSDAARVCSRFLGERERLGPAYADELRGLLERAGGVRAERVEPKILDRKKTIDTLVLNGPYEEPREYWSYDRASLFFQRREGRRPAGYIVASNGAGHDDPGRFVEMPLVNAIRDHVRAWRQDGWPGVSGVTRRLLAHWTHERVVDAQRLFFCQVEAVETLIWMTEYQGPARAGVVLPDDGGPFERLCAKMATGTGKTIVMAMVVAWQVLNHARRPADPRFARHVLVMAPGRTVRSRLSVLEPSAPDNYYDAFDVVPSEMREDVNRARVVVRNWQALGWESADDLRRRRSVDKRGPKSDAAYMRWKLPELVGAPRVVVLNDEAHHAYRLREEDALGKDERRRATVWIGVLDRVHRAIGVGRCFDFTATPFVSGGTGAAEERLFGWIASDFGLNDAIESGLVKTPRVVIRDDAVPDATTYRSKLFHIYSQPDVRDDLNRKAEAHEPLPDLVVNAYHLLGKDWLETALAWKAGGAPTPPVMITVANRTETAARVRYAFQHGLVRVEGLGDAAGLLHIDSKVLDAAEATDADDSEAEGESEGPKRSNKQTRAERLRRIVGSVGKVGEPGEQIQNVISVQMLSEGWDARTVTHIMGLRAFNSQLLCEQVVGRGLRRVSYDVDPETKRLRAEYVNVFGVPFTFLPHEEPAGESPRPTPAKTRIEALAERSALAITWPNVLRIEHQLTPVLTLPSDTEPLVLDARDIAMHAELAPILDGRPFQEVSEIELRKLADRLRMQQLVFEAARDVFAAAKRTATTRSDLVWSQILRIAQDFIESDRIQIRPEAFAADPLRRRIVLALKVGSIVNHLWSAVRDTNTERRVMVLDPDRPTRSTSDMAEWWTSRPCARTVKSHINFAVFDSTWESEAAVALDRHEAVEAWVKNERLGFDLVYTRLGRVRKYRPDFLVRLHSGLHVVLEIKGEPDEESDAKADALRNWVDAVTEDGRFGCWVCAMTTSPRDVEGVLTRLAGERRAAA